ncbi:baseplate multidomain protein megatron [Rhodovulum adriaticum]|uniref:Putative tail protein n=1 Tax=Rhodovulum adriaticum TaxID=35804 RepID=A0A4R2NV76_RHOAD|nr:glycoside hydrolase TIM-barrel-like domain-containing protein [Rhodovulum adriaticum]MBK1636913.1 hypothetical protein [Rhodovulum adriaticum]TCP25468.1 putative tail protein [Rhodovulum adriaticum]
MATIVFSAIGAAAGAAWGGAVLGLSSTVIGRAVGATIGRVVDQQLLGSGSDAVETGRVERFRLTGASEGTAVPRLWGRSRMSGQVIWASRFRETVESRGGGKGMPGKPKIRVHSYTVSLAIALCEGEIARVGRIWADGLEIAPGDLTLRVYNGTEDQLPDPLIEATEGAGQAPSYRGIAYVVIEEMDLLPYGNRVPQLSFEVMREADCPVETLSDLVQGVALIPGTGEYALATVPVHFKKLLGETTTANMNTPSGRTDMETSLEALRADLPGVRSVSLVVSWFASDLRAPQVALRPKVDQALREGQPLPWRVSGLRRADAEIIPQRDGRAIYGGTPADGAVAQAIAALRAGGQDTLFYPFILMDQMEGNDLTDPYTGDPGQPYLPWRGRITLSHAPGHSLSPDGTAAAEDEIAALFGTAAPEEFAVAGSLDKDKGLTVTYSGDDGWSYRRFILHYAWLCKAAGGVAGFCIGSELRGLTTIRGPRGRFPVVEQLRRLAADVRAILGPDCKIGYAADWSEYFGFRPPEAPGDLYFHLDPLWSDPNIDFIGIDNYMPLSDWREGDRHLDAGWGTIHDLDYLRANIEGGEGYDWYYASDHARDIQRRTPIRDEAHGEHWIYRYKDLRGWWGNEHADRVGGRKASLIPEGVRPALWPIESGCTIRASDAPVHDGLTPADIVSGGLGAASRATVLQTALAEAVYRVRVVFRAGSAPSACVSWTHATAWGQVVWSQATGQVSTEVGGGAQVMNLTFSVGEDGVIDLRFRLRLAEADAAAAFHVGNGDTVEGAYTTFYLAELWQEGVSPTGWVPQGKPIWFTELGCPAVDKGTNAPNLFHDPNSSESAFPPFSTGARDDLIQQQYLRAVLGYWADPQVNPVSEVYGGPMVDLSRAHVWTWDARPFPEFPTSTAVWADGANYARGHWLTGRANAQPLEAVISEICRKAGVTALDLDGVQGLVRGYVVAENASARAALQPLMLAHGLEAAERDGRLVFFKRDGRSDHIVSPDALAVTDGQAGEAEHFRSPDAETAGRVRLVFAEAEGAYETRAVEAILPDEVGGSVTSSEMPLVMARGEAQAIVSRWLAEARVARDRVRLALPPSAHAVGAGDVIRLPQGGFRVDRVEQAATRNIEAVRVERGVYAASPVDLSAEGTVRGAHVPPLPVEPLFLDLPLLSGDEIPHAPHIAIAATPWPGSVALYSAAEDAGYRLNTLVERGAVAGVTLGPLFAAAPARWDRGPALRVQVASGALSSISDTALFAGGNLAAIGDGTPGGWELIQFAEAELMAPGTYDLRMRLRGQAGTEAEILPARAAGAYFVLLDGAAVQIELSLDALGMARHFLIGPGGRPMDDPSYIHRVEAFSGIGLRPYAPCHLRARTTPAGDRGLTWTRRTRSGGDGWELAEVPLGESREAYHLRVRDGTGAILREASTDAASWTYTAAMQAQDGTAAPFAIEVAQLSEAFGPGPYRRIDFHG